jgi:MFS family permease
MAWGLFPLVFTAAHMEPRPDRHARGHLSGGVGPLSALHRGAGPIALGRKWLIASGMWVQAVGIAIVALSGGFAGFATGATLLGLGTALVYPTLLASIGDVAHPAWRASAVGVYRLFRDLGYAVGALVAGLVADALGLPSAMWLVAALTLASGVVVAVRMRETLSGAWARASASRCSRSAST